MARIIPETELTSLISAVAQHPAGASLSQILADPTNATDRRSTQRRLALLIKQGRLNATGRGPNRRYHIHSPFSKSIADDSTEEVEIEISDASRVIQRAVTGPIQQRKPVGYNRKFLDEYEPNESFYLPQEVRTHLANIGRAIGEDLPAGTYVRTIFNRLLIDLSWNSSRLEGNTYSLLETTRLLEFGEHATGKDLTDAQMILNHKSAIELLVEDATEIGFNRYTICNLHALLSDNLLQDPGGRGRVRKFPVGIGGTVYLPLEVPQQIDECFQQLLNTAEAINDPFEQSFFALIHLPYLQPFEDVNKRVSRLAANIPFVRHNLSPLSFVDVPQKLYIDALLAVYEINRIELMRDLFIWAYERSSARYSAIRGMLGEPEPFRMRYRELLRSTIADIVRKNLDSSGATRCIADTAAERVPVEDRERFRTEAETELLSLHIGNIAPYKLRPSEFESWLSQWNRPQAK